MFPCMLLCELVFTELESTDADVELLCTMVACFARPWYVQKRAEHRSHDMIGSVDPLAVFNLTLCIIWKE